MKRDYPKNALLQHFRRANAHTQEQALMEHIKVSNTERQILITQFHPQNPNLRKIVDKHWNIIQYSRDCSELFKEKPIIGFRKLPNLRDKLTNAKCIYPEPKVEKPPIPKIELCKKFLTCKYCAKFKYRTHTSNYNHTQEWKCDIPQRSRVTCKINNVVYGIICRACKKEYVGETLRNVQRRMYEHILSVEKPAPYRDTPVSRHFQRPNHSSKDMEFHIIEWCKDKPTSYRKDRESFWIWKKKTIQKFGINQML